MALAAGWGKARDCAPGLKCSRLFGNLFGFFLPWEAHTTKEYCGVDGRRIALDLTAMGRTRQWRLKPPARYRHVWDHSQATLYSSLPAREKRSFAQSEVVFTDENWASPSPSPQPIEKLLLVSLGRACRSLVTLPEMRLHQLPALQHCII